MRRGFSAGAIAVVYCAVVWAQFQLGSVSGLVRDQSQAPVPGAVVEARSASTNVVSRVVTDASGQFTFVSRRVGPWRGPGFE